MNSASYFQSVIDTCKGTVNSGNIDTMCPGGAHTFLVGLCTNGDRLRGHFNDNSETSNTNTSILWSGHKLDDNRSFSQDATIMSINLFGSNRESGSRSVLFHELMHQYGGPDHYHEILYFMGIPYCRGGSMCDDISHSNPSPRPGSCIMDDCWQVINSSYTTNLICSGCKQDTLNHLNNHH